MRRARRRSLADDICVANPQGSIIPAQPPEDRVIIDPAKPIERWGLSPRGRERMHALLGQPWLRSVGLVLSSSEQKALDGAEILAPALGVPHRVVPELGEYDRSSTGLLPPAQFWPLVEQFASFSTARPARLDTCAPSRRGEGAIGSGERRYSITRIGAPRSHAAMSSTAWP